MPLSTATEIPTTSSTVRSSSNRSRHYAVPRPIECQLASLVSDVGYVRLNEPSTAGDEVNKTLIAVAGMCGASVLVLGACTSATTNSGAEENGAMPSAAPPGCDSFTIQGGGKILRPGRSTLNITGGSTTVCAASSRYDGTGTVDIDGQGEKIVVAVWAGGGLDLSLRLAAPSDPSRSLVAVGVLKQVDGQGPFSGVLTDDEDPPTNSTVEGLVLVPN